MRKVKVNVQFKVPSWNYCNKDVATSDGRYSRELCKFCIQSTDGYYCQLYEEYLAADRTFVYKPEVCKRMTAGYKEDIVEPEAIPVDPKLIIRETLKQYNKILTQLMSQGYPQYMAEKVATKYILDEQ